MTIKAIETRYAGCHFRSRLEARWAVFFDHLNIRWEYEPEGFVGSGGRAYLPDFRLHLPGEELYVEVKGSDEQLRADAEKIGDAIAFNASPVSSGLLLLGPIPDVRQTWGTFVSHWLLFCANDGVAMRHFQFDREVFSGVTCERVLLPNWNNSNLLLHSLPNEASVNASVWSISVNDRSAILSREVFDAYQAARSARFEHGESGVPRHVANPITPRKPGPVDPTTGRATLGARIPLGVSARPDTIEGAMQ